MDLSDSKAFSEYTEFPRMSPTTFNPQSNLFLNTVKVYAVFSLEVYAFNYPPWFSISNSN